MLPSPLAHVLSFPDTPCMHLSSCRHMLLVHCGPEHVRTKHRLCLCNRGAKPSACGSGTGDGVQAEKVDTLPNGRQLTYGEYRDVGRPLRRMLKQHGAGSLEKGMAAVRGSDTALQELSHLVNVDPAVSPAPPAHQLHIALSVRVHV